MTDYIYYVLLTLSHYEHFIKIISFIYEIIYLIYDPDLRRLSLSGQFRGFCVGVVRLQKVHFVPGDCTSCSPPCAPSSRRWCAASASYLSKLSHWYYRCRHRHRKTGRLCPKEHIFNSCQFYVLKIYMNLWPLVRKSLMWSFICHVIFYQTLFCVMMDGRQISLSPFIDLSLKNKHRQAYTRTHIHTLHNTSLHMWLLCEKGSNRMW